MGTTSAGIAASNGYSDGEKIPFQLMLDSISEIVAGIDVPVTADLEAGYSKNVNEIAKNVVRVAKTGVVGINLEDKRPGDGCLLSISDQIEVIRVVRNITESYGLSLFINARTDVLWGHNDSSATTIENVIRRCVAYSRAGADGVFVPGLLKVEHIVQLLREIDVPLNVLALPGGSDIACLQELGVRRLSLGSGPMRMAMSAVVSLTRTIKESKSFDKLFAGCLTYAELNDLSSGGQSAREHE